MNGFFSSVPPARDWFYGVRTFAASMIALYIALLMQLPRPYWAMATVYIVSSPFLGPTSSKALYRALGTLLGAGGAIFLVPPLVQSPLLLSIAIALWTGTLLFLSLNLRTANNYVLMLAGYTLPMIALAVVDNPLAVFDVASSRAQEICLGIVCAAVVLLSRAQKRAAPVTSLRVYLFDCGLIKGEDPLTYGLNPGDVKNADMVVPCYLIVHPKGTLMWDVGVIPDSAFKGGKPVTEEGDTVSSPKPLLPQLAAIGYPAEKITYIAFSHYHFDHTANANAFAGSTWL